VKNVDRDSPALHAEGAALQSEIGSTSVIKAPSEIAEADVAGGDSTDLSVKAVSGSPRRSVPPCGGDVRASAGKEVAVPQRPTDGVKDRATLQDLPGSASETVLGTFNPASTASEEANDGGVASDCGACGSVDSRTESQALVDQAREFLPAVAESSHVRAGVRVTHADHLAHSESPGDMSLLELISGGQMLSGSNLGSWWPWSWPPGNEIEGQSGNAWSWRFCGGSHLHRACGGSNLPMQRTIAVQASEESF